MLLFFRDNARDRLGTIGLLLPGGPEKSIRLPFGPAERPLAKLPRDLVANMADQRQPRQPSQQRGERIDVVLVAVEDLDRVAFRPPGQPPGVPERRRRPTPAWPRQGIMGK